MKYEYILVRKDKIIAEKRAERDRDSEGDEVLILEGFNELGRDGWELFQLSGDLFAKRPV